jgi:hypothetical protein
MLFLDVANDFILAISVMTLLKTISALSNLVPLDSVLLAKIFSMQNAVKMSMLGVPNARPLKTLDI